ncbi:hypothetical protein [Tumebacillus permanentifrigoris]|uniref:Uncharacterized protein n=1 Tax=Tumebacillus permanentifrigoris TaxID=378543 RepID=A0A316D3B6_9BACL|nr:hypothetical protein [Tumebacillus permanentifrigoris]PWK05330.1 hypothetical protein C7459_12482 [Tumebacillus permanentifrigoris]
MTTKQTTPSPMLVLGRHNIAPAYCPPERLEELEREAYNLWCNSLSGEEEFLEENTGAAEAIAMIKWQAERIAELEKQVQTAPIRALIEMYDRNELEYDDLYSQIQSRIMELAPFTDDWMISVDEIWGRWDDEFADMEQEVFSFVDEIRAAIGMEKRESGEVPYTDLKSVLDSHYANPRLMETGEVFVWCMKMKDSLPAGLQELIHDWEKSDDTVENNKDFIARIRAAIGMPPKEEPTC